ncbi:MAG: GGDEF domain-containing protein [Phycisphaerae bacterium]|nr:GGDEF domain-containing protein [Phycisphaerae bacterium]
MPFQSNKPVATRKFIRFTMIAFALALVCAAMAAHEFRRSAATRELFAQDAERIARDVIDEFGRAVDPDLHNLQSLCSRSLSKRQVFVARVMDSTGKVLAHAEKTSAFESVLARSSSREVPDGGALAEMIDTAQLKEPADGIYAIVTTKLHSASASNPLTLAVIARVDLRGIDAKADLWQFHLPLACIMIAGLFVVDARLNRRLVDPLTTLARTSAEFDPCAEPTESEPEAPVDSLAARGSLAELLSLNESISAAQMHCRLWRRMTQITERRVDSQVARETKRIISDLNRVRKEAWQDALTGVNNRRYLEEQFPPIFDAQFNANRDLSVIMFDLDNFKQVNDTIGHGAGDDVLRFTGELLRQCVRSDDCAIRYGGDEFIVILPGASADSAARLANRILSLFAQRLRAMFDKTLLPTLTAGVASIFGNRAKTPGELLACADHALLSAKQAGKAQAVTSPIDAAHFRQSGRTMRIQVRSSTPLPAKL